MQWITIKLDMYVLISIIMTICNISVKAFDYIKFAQTFR